MINELVEIAEEMYQAKMKFADRVFALETDTIAFCCTSPERTAFHVYSGIEKLAAEAGVDIKTQGRDDDTYPWEHSFEYGGVLFYQIDKARGTCSE